MQVTLQVASQPGHYVAARELIQSEGVKPVNLEFPTILAYDVESKKLVGVCGTHHQDDLLLAGPLVLESSFPRFKTALQLCEAYEHAMKMLGIKSFTMVCPKDSIIAEAIDRYKPENIELYATEGDNRFYIWRRG